MNKQACGEPVSFIDLFRDTINGKLTLNEMDRYKAVHFCNDLTDRFKDRLDDIKNKKWKKLETGYQLQIDVPGYEKSELSIKEHKGILTITAENEDRGKFFYQTSCPEDMDDFVAAMRNGVLIVEGKIINKETEIKII